MAYAVTQTTSSGSNNFTTSHTVTLPSGIVAGNKLLVSFATEGSSSGTTNTPAGWTKEVERVEDSGAETVRLVVYSKTAVGSDTLTVTTTGSVDSAYTCYKFHTNNSIRIGTPVDGGGTNPNPPSFTPVGGSQEYLWVAITAFQSGTVSAYPANYTANQLTDTAETYNIASAIYAHEDSSEDPGTFTTNSGNWVAVTVAIEAQDPVEGNFGLLTSNGTIFSPAIDYPADATFTVVTKVSQIFTPTADVSTRAVWKNKSKPSTTWTSTDKD